jgi:hypothetical protein
MPTSKLHQLLAVEGNLQSQSSKTRAELKATFQNKRHLFQQKLVTFTAFAEGGQTAQPVTEEQSDIQSSVADEIDWIKGIVSKALDASHHIDIANAQAKADVVTEDGETLLKDVPATSLLQLEKRLKEIHELASAIPTLDPAKGFTVDLDRDKNGNVFRARQVVKTRTRKTKRVITLAQATKEHPAQTALVDEDMPVGEITELEWSSLITPATKSEILNRCEVLLRALKKARAKANEAEVDVSGNLIGRKLLDYVFAPLRGGQLAVGSTG